MKRRIFSLVLALLILFSLAACGGAAPADRAEAPAAAADAPAPAAAAPDRGYMAEADSAPRPAAEAESDYFLFPILTPSNAGDRRLVYTVSMRLQTTEFLPGMRLLLDTVAEAGGYLVTADVHGSDLNGPLTAQTAEFSFRVPTEGLAGLIFVVENNYNILHLRQDMEERTASYQRNEWSLDDLREQERQILEELEELEDNDEDERFWLTSWLRDVQSSIREIEAAQATIMQDVVYSTIDVVLMEVFLPEDGVPGPRVEPMHVVLATLALLVIVLGAILLGRRPPDKKIDTQTEES